MATYEELFLHYSAAALTGLLASSPPPGSLPQKEIAGTINLTIRMAEAFGEILARRHANSQTTQTTGRSDDQIMAEALAMANDGAAQQRAERDAAANRAPPPNAWTAPLQQRQQQFAPQQPQYAPQQPYQQPSPGYQQPYQPPAAPPPHFPAQNLQQPSQYAPQPVYQQPMPTSLPAPSPNYGQDPSQGAPPQTQQGLPMRRLHKMSKCGRMGYKAFVRRSRTLMRKLRDRHDWASEAVRREALGIFRPGTWEDMTATNRRSAVTERFVSGSDSSRDTLRLAN